MSTTPSAGRSLGRFEVLKLLGAGGMGQVYRARDRELGREVAVKVLPAELAGDPAWLERLRREAQALAALNHPNIVTVYGIEALEGDGSLCLVMELVEGRTLRELLQPGGLPLAQFLAVAIPLADAVAAAHERRIAHRDLKPANVMVTHQGRVKVLDFGLAKQIAGAGADASAAPTSLTGAGALVGTPAYMAPEQLRGGDADPRADVFALGVVLHELLTGACPFARPTAADTIGAVLHQEPADLGTLRPELPDELARIVRRCLAKDPGRRTQTAIDVRNALEELRDELARPRTAAASAAVAGRRGALAERAFPLTIEHVRRLSRRDPRLVGRAMVYTENDADPEALVVYLHGTGLDHRQFAPVQLRADHRALAVSLVGFEPDAAERPALPVEDHLLLLHAFVHEQVRRLRPRRVVLVGFSSGADLCLRLAAEPPEPALELHGIVALGANVSRATCFVTGLYAQLSDRAPEALLATLKDLGREYDNLDLWLTLQDYLVQTFGKFGSQVEPLRVFSTGITAPFDAERSPFPGWYRAATERVPVVRCVFASPESVEAERLLARHLAEDVLGPRFEPATFRLEAMDHLRLADTDYLLRIVDEALAAGIGATDDGRDSGVK